MISGPERSAATSLERDTINVRAPLQVDRSWIMPPWLAVVFAAMQLCAGLKYFHVGLTEVWIKTHGQRAQEPTNAGIPEFSGLPMPSPRRFLTRDYQDAFERAAQTNFLFPQARLLPRYQDFFMRLSQRSVDSILVLPMTAKPLLGEYTLARTGADERICGRPALYRQEDEAKLLERASYYNALQAAWPRVHFYVFPTLLVADWYAVAGLYGAGAEKYLAGDRYLRKFRTLLDPAIGYAWAAEGCSFPDAIARYYRTDHHWNFPGAYQAYRQLCPLLYQKNPEIGPPREPVRWITLPDLVFHGSLAHCAGCYDAFGDALVDAIFELPELKVRVYGFEERQRNARQQYLAGQYAPGPFANHYAEYFGYDYGLIEYASGAPGSGNLLVISDSFDNPIEPLLASHFGHCWFVDLRHYAKDVREKFDLGDFLQRRQITDVLFLGNQYLTLGVGLNPFP